MGKMKELDIKVRNGDKLTKVEKEYLESLKRINFKS